MATSSSRPPSGGFRFRVSDAVEVPLRGYILRLRLMDGLPQMDRLRPGLFLHLAAPDGTERFARILDHAIVGGRATQARLERTRELDVIISRADALADGRPIQAGWWVVGTSASAGERAA